MYPARTRRKCTAERRSGGVCESGSDSGSSSGSVRASRGRWGSWSSTSSVEGDRDAGARTHPCTTSSRKSKKKKKQQPSNEVKQSHWKTSLTIVSDRGIHVQRPFRGARLLPRGHQCKLQDFKVSRQTVVAFFLTLYTNFCVLCFSLYRKDQCQSPDPPASSFIPSFAAVAAGVEKNLEKEAHGELLRSLR